MARLEVGELTVKELIRQYKSGNIEARDKIIKRYMKFVDEAVLKFKGFYLSDEDLFQSAFEGLLIAIEHFKIENKNFTKNVKQSITLNILREVKRYMGIGGLSNVDIEKMKQIDDVIKSLEVDLERAPYIEEIFLELEDLNIPISEKEVRDFMIINSLLESVDPRNIEGDIFPIEQASQRVTEQEIIIKELSEILNSKINEKLTPKQIYVIVLKYLKEFDSSRKFIYKSLGVSRTYVYDIEKRGAKSAWT